jgi:hypothetical protein
MPLSASGPPGSALLPRAAPLQRVKCAVGTVRRRPDSVVPTAPPPLSETPRPVPTVPLPLPKAVPPPCPNPASVRPSDTVVSFIRGESSPSSPLAVLHSWSVELTFPSLLPITGPPPVTVAPPHQKNATAELVFSPSPSTRSSDELSPPPPCPVGSLTVVGARLPSFGPPPPLCHHRRLRRCQLRTASVVPCCNKH